MSPSDSSEPSVCRRCGEICGCPRTVKIDSAVCSVDRPVPTSAAYAYLAKLTAPCDRTQFIRVLNLLNPEYYFMYHQL